jgi:hypothetical protein
MTVVDLRQGGVGSVREVLEAGSGLGKRHKPCNLTSKTPRIGAFGIALMTRRFCR